MKLHFQTTYNMLAYSEAIVMPTLPDEIKVYGYLECREFGTPTFHASIGDYILLEWEPGCVCKFNKYGRYGNGNDLDNLRAEDLKVDLFRQLVGDSFSPSSVEDINE